MQACLSDIPSQQLPFPFTAKRKRKAEKRAITCNTYIILYTNMNTIGRLFLGCCPLLRYDMSVVECASILLMCLNMAVNHFKRATYVRSKLTRNVHTCNKIVWKYFYCIQYNLSDHLLPSGQRYRYRVKRKKWVHSKFD